MPFFSHFCTRRWRWQRRRRSRSRERERPKSLEGDTRDVRKSREAVFVREKERETVEWSNFVRSVYNEGDVHGRKRSPRLRWRVIKAFFSISLLYSVWKWCVRTAVIWSQKCYDNDLLVCAFSFRRVGLISNELLYIIFSVRRVVGFLWQRNWCIGYNT